LPYDSRESSAARERTRRLRRRRHRFGLYPANVFRLARRRRRHRDRREYRTPPAHATRCAAAEQERRIAADAPRRAEVKALALEVARYQAFASEAGAFRRSGTDAAIALARIGNSIPNRVWIDSVERVGDGGYTVAGGAGNVAVLGSTVVSLGRALPKTRAAIVTIDTRQNDGNVRFSARIADPASVASPVPGAPAARPGGTP